METPLTSVVVESPKGMLVGVQKMPVQVFFCPWVMPQCILWTWFANMDEWNDVHVSRLL